MAAANRSQRQSPASSLPPPVEQPGSPEPEQRRKIYAAGSSPRENLEISDGPQLIAAPRCAHCKSTKVKIVSTQGVPVKGKRWQRQKYRCENVKCPGNTVHSVIMRGPFGVWIGGDREEAGRVDLEEIRKRQPPAPKSRIDFTR